MAAKLIESSDVPHTVTHDLESFFWVLLWMVMAQVETNWEGKKLSLIFYDVMNCRAGSVVKADFLKTDRLAEEEFEIPGNPYLRRLLEELQTTIASWYRKQKKWKNMPSPSVTKEKMESGIMDSKSNMKESGDHKLPQVSSEFKELYEKFSLHFSQALNTTGWPEDDKAEPQDILWPADIPRNKLCGSKRSWDALLTNSSCPSLSKQFC